MSSIDSRGKSVSFVPSQNYFELVVGDKEIQKEIKKKVRKYQIPAGILVDNSLRWPRDCRVVLPDQKHLIPALISQLDDKMFYSLLPSSMLHFMTEGRCYTGHGISRHYQETAKKLATNRKTPFVQGLSCVEGGNCQIFKGAKGETKAIVGYTSLLLTISSLSEEKFFQNHSSELDQYATELVSLSSADSLRIARNLAYADRGIDQDLKKELNQGEEREFMALAKKVEAMFFLAKQKIAEELGIPLERIAFVFQERFHIDMELFVGPDDLVFLHDEALMLDLQQKIQVPCPFLKNTSKYSESHLALNQRILEENTKVLEQIGCKVVRVPGVLTAEFEEASISYPQIINDWVGEEVFLPGEEPTNQRVERPKYVNLLNFMNGLFFPDPIPRWISTGVLKSHVIADFFKKAFKKAVTDHCPELRISLVQISKLSSYLIMGSGGLRCVTSPM